MKTRQKEGKKFTKVKRRKNHRTRPSNSNSNVHILEQPVSLLVAEAPSLGTGCFSTTAFDLEAPFRSSYFFKRQVECFDSVSFFVAPRYNCKSIPSFGVEHYLWPRFVVDRRYFWLRLITSCHHVGKQQQNIHHCRGDRLRISAGIGFHLLFIRSSSSCCLGRRTIPNNHNNPNPLHPRIARHALFSPESEWPPNSPKGRKRHQAIGLRVGPPGPARGRH